MDNPSTALTWWEKWPGRLNAEIRSFENNDIEVAVDEEEKTQGRIVLRGAIDTDRGDVAFEVRYPSTYPLIRFAVIAPTLSLDRHQHPFGKSLCVFPRGSEHWRRDWLAGDVVADRIPDLLAAVARGGEFMREAEDPQGEPFTDYYTYTPQGGFIIEPEVMDHASGSDRGKMVVQLTAATDWIVPVNLDSGLENSLPTGSGLVVSLSDQDNAEVEAPVPVRRTHQGVTLKGRWLRVSAPPDSDDWGVIYKRVLDENPHLRNSPENRVNGRLMQLIGLVFTEEVRQDEYGDAWVFLAAIRQPRKQGKGRRRKTRPAEDQVMIVPIRGLRSGVAHAGERIPELAPVRSKSVTIFGLGTLGSPFAKEMARSMIGKLHLGDHDFTDPATSVRHELGYEFAGVSKPYALAELFRRNYPYTEVLPDHFFVGGDPTHEGELDVNRLGEILRTTDLLVDASAEDNVTAALAQEAWQAQIPFLALWSIEGSGGVVARLVPGETGCFYCMELHISADRGTIELPAPPKDPKRVQPKGCADPTFTSPAADMMPLVSLASRMAFGELTIGSSSSYPRHNGDAYVLWLRQPDGSLHDPPRWDSHRLDVHPDCPFHDV